MPSCRPSKWHWRTITNLLNGDKENIFLRRGHLLWYNSTEPTTLLFLITTEPKTSWSLHQNILKLQIAVLNYNDLRTGTWRRYAHLSLPHRSYTFIKIFRFLQFHISHLSGYSRATHLHVCLNSRKSITIDLGYHHLVFCNILFGCLGNIFIHISNYLSNYMNEKSSSVDTFLNKQKTVCKRMSLNPRNGNNTYKTMLRPTTIA